MQIYVVYFENANLQPKNRRLPTFWSFEYYENEYFGDGWPKELFYQKNSTQGENAQIELKKITWLRRSVGND